MKNIGLITVVQSLHVPTETQELSPGAQQGGWKEKLLSNIVKLLYALTALQNLILHLYLFSHNFFLQNKILRDFYSINFIYKDASILILWQ